MSQKINFTIDGKECVAEKGTYIVNAAKESGVYIPTLCNLEGIAPKGACRICNVRVNGKLMTACTTPVSNGMVIENSSEDMLELRKSILELMFTEGNHFCPACERSGNCELQALAYRFQMMVPRFNYQFPLREIEATHPKLIKDHNRCIRCKRCIRVIKDKKERSLFAFAKRGSNVSISIDTKLAYDMTDEQATQAAEICPVGAILKKEVGFSTPIGQRKYDKNLIGSEIESAG
jgi:[NiFe] hydrogenase diaphorase moiety small subunit